MHSVLLIFDVCFFFSIETLEIEWKCYSLPQLNCIPNFSRVSGYDNHTIDGVITSREM